MEIEEKYAHIYRKYIREAHLEAMNKVAMEWATDKGIGWETKEFNNFIHSMYLDKRFWNDKLQNEGIVKTL